MARLNLTYPTALVLKALAAGFHYGFDVMDATGLPSGTVYPILRRLDREGLLESSWEKQTSAQQEQRPPRRYYALTGAGERMLADALLRFPTLDDAVGRAGRRMRPARV
jgi:PadR family transcriptional regulator PadR